MYLEVSGSFLPILNLDSIHTMEPLSQGQTDRYSLLMERIDNCDADNIFTLKGGIVLLLQPVHIPITTKKELLLAVGCPFLNISLASSNGENSRNSSFRRISEGYRLRRRRSFNSGMWILIENVYINDVAHTQVYNLNSFCTI
ncbi:uncharacterized protein LOC113272287 [Papaver somniferum]|uniref:uncharacterized protein LOC113272287 n=1 Tax=Papaver somniferum TaxID=3469 RepID=UPI000E6FBEA2|nr:uncharacterized protein LOC113272287 [Papaver somniferum]